MLFFYIRRHNNVSDVTSHLTNILFFQFCLQNGFGFKQKIKFFRYVGNINVLFICELKIIEAWWVYVNNILPDIILLLFWFYFLNWIELIELCMIFLGTIHVSNCEVKWYIRVVDWEDNCLESVPRISFEIGGTDIIAIITFVKSLRCHQCEF